MNTYPNTPIIYEHPEGIDQVSTQFQIAQIGYFFDNVILPLAIVLFVILHFRDDKNIYLYTVFMVILSLMVPTWFLLVVGLFLMGLDQASKLVTEYLNDH